MPEDSLTLAEFQRQIAATFGTRDAARGPEASFLWLVAEVGELAEALRVKDPENLAGEFADVLAWLTTLANLTGVDMTTAVRRKYGTGCSRCGRSPCACPVAGKP